MDFVNAGNAALRQMWLPQRPIGRNLLLNGRKAGEIAPKMHGIAVNSHA
jgi:hypothetical protein